MLAKPQTLMGSYVNNSEVIMLFKVFSENELRDFFKEKWEILKSKKIVEIQDFSLKYLLRGGKRNNKIKLNANKAVMFSQLLLLLMRVSLV